MGLGLVRRSHVPAGPLVRFILAGLPGITLEIPGTPAGLGAGLSCLVRLPHWLAAPGLPGTEALEEQVNQASARLKESEARLQGFIQHAPAAIAFKGLDGSLLLANRRAEALVGRSLAATPEPALEELFPPDWVARARSGS